MDMVRQGYAEREVYLVSLTEELNRRGDGTLPGLVGVEILAAEEGRIGSRLALRDDLMAPNGYLHAATISRSPILVRLRLLRHPPGWCLGLYHGRVEE